MSIGHLSRVAQIEELRYFNATVRKEPNWSESEPYSILFRATSQQVALGALPPSTRNSPLGSA